MIIKYIIRLHKYLVFLETERIKAMIKSGQGKV